MAPPATITRNCLTIADREQAARRARTEWPLFNTDLTRQPLPDANSLHNHRPNRSSEKAATDFLVHIVAASAGAPPFYFDQLTVEVGKRTYKYSHKDLNEVMFGIYYRARIQSTFLDLLHLLGQWGSFDRVEGFAEPIFAVQFERNASLLAGYLECFQFCSETVHNTLQVRLVGNCADGYLDYASYWLAVVLLRGQTSKVTDFWQLFDVIEQTGFLESLLRDKFEKYGSRKHNLDLRQNSQLGNSGYYRFNQIAGWFLPDAVTRPKMEDKGNTSKLEPEYSAAIERFDIIEAAVKNYFGWDDSTVLLAKDQLAQVQMEQNCETSGII